MKNKLIKILFYFGIIFSFFNFTYAHELIPKELKEYVENNPNATPSEIKAFVDKQNPELAKKYSDGEEILIVVRNQQTNFLDNMYDFFVIGVKHILSGPDHILFVLSILLVFVSIASLFKFTGVFTVAHSITLLLAGTGLLTLSSRIVEPFIALSIAYVAITTVYFRQKKFFGTFLGKSGAIFFFGLFHGLGFAGLLKELSIPSDKFISSLIAFNLGIEGGQLIIIAIALPFILLLKKHKNFDLIIKIFAIIISLIAIVWFFQRITV